MAYERDGSLFYNATGFHESDMERPMFIDLIQAGSVMAMYGVPPEKAFDYSLFKPAIKFGTPEMDAAASMTGFDYHRIGQEGYTGPALNEAMEHGKQLAEYANRTPELQHMTGAAVSGALLLSVAVVRYVCERYPSYKSDFFQMMKMIAPTLTPQGAQSRNTSAPSKTTKAAAASSGGCLLPMVGIIGAMVLPLAGLGVWLLS